MPRRLRGWKWIGATAKSEVLSRVGLGEGEAGQGQFQELHIVDNQFVVGFPTINPAADGQVRDALVKVRFRGRVIDFRTNFFANAFLDTLSADVERRFTRNGILAVTGGRRYA